MNGRAVTGARARRRGSLLAIASAILISGSCTTDSPLPLAGRLDALSGTFLVSSGTPGLAVGVWKDDTVVYARGFGVLATGAPSPVTPRSVFHMASVSKTVVATCVMQLVEQGRVQLDAPVTAYVPYFRLRDPRYRAITVRQLLSHTAGLPDVTDYRWDRPEYDDGALERWIRSLADSTLVAAPGEGWHYGNIGFELLAAVVATVSGESFEAYARKHVPTRQA